MNFKPFFIGVASIFLLSCTLTPTRTVGPEPEAVKPAQDNRYTIITVERQNGALKPVYQSIKGCDLFVMPQVAGRPLVPEVPAAGMTDSFKNVLLDYVLKLDEWMEKRDATVDTAYNTYANKCRRILRDNKAG